MGLNSGFKGLKNIHNFVNVTVCVSTY